MKSKINDNKARLFSVERLTGGGHTTRFCEHLKICCVELGEAFVSVYGESRSVSAGQIVTVAPFENYSIELMEDTSILVLSIGREYLRYFFSLHPGKKPPRWLMDREFNHGLIKAVRSCGAETLQMQNELKLTGIVCSLLSDVIEHYGLEKMGYETTEDTEDDLKLIANVVQYIHTHCSEKITLDTLSKSFYVSPTALSKKLRKRLGVDLRVFVNDIRVQKAARMMEDPQYKKASVNEIAELCGFSSMSTFYRCYRRNFGSKKTRR